jgi:hypothetical protein
MVIDTAGIVHNYTLQENTWGGANYVTKSFDDKFILAASHELPSQTTSDILLYKIYENLEQDTLYPGYYAYDSLCKKLPIQSEIIDLGDCYAITGIGEIPTLEQYNKKMQSIGISASPNPSNSGEILLEYENTESFTNLELHITDVYGKPIHREAVLPHQGATRLSTNSWPAGMYIATIMSNGQMRGKCKILVE